MDKEVLVAEGKLRSQLSVARKGLQEVGEHKASKDDKTHNLN